MPSWTVFVRVFMHVRGDWTCQCDCHGSVRIDWRCIRVTTASDMRMGIVEQMVSDGDTGGTTIIAHMGTTILS